MSPPLRLRYVDLEDGQLHLAEQGAGAPLVLLGETPRSWRFFEKLLPLLPASRRLLAVDLPGFGGSDPLSPPFTIEAMASRLADGLEAMGIERADLFGVHTGNKVAAAFAAIWPARVGRLVLAGQSHSLHVDAAARNAALGPSFARYRGDGLGNRDTDEARLQAWLGAKLALDQTWWAGDAALGRPDDILSAEAKVIDLLRGWRSAVPVYQAVFAFDLAAAAEKIEADTLVLELQSPEESDQHGQGARLAKLLRRGRHVTLPVDHFAALERQPAAIASAITPFIDGDQE
jgi:pimeloyl-ACP methyl ester carboxylesterase